LFVADSVKRRREKATVLYGLNVVRDLDQLSRGGISIGKWAANFIFRTRDLFRALFLAKCRALAFRSIVLSVVLNLRAICEALVPFATIAINCRSAFEVKRPYRPLPAIKLFLFQPQASAGTALSFS
jgi:hypothetical protein